MELFMSAKRVQEHTTLTEGGAKKRLARLRKLYKIPRYEKVNVLLYCEHYHMDVKLFIAFLEQQEDPKNRKNKLRKY